MQTAIGNGGGALDAQRGGMRTRFDYLASPQTLSPRYDLKQRAYAPRGAIKEDGCLSRVPYCSLMGFTMCFVGVVLFSMMMLWAFNASVSRIDNEQHGKYSPLIGGTNAQSAQYQRYSMAR